MRLRFTLMSGQEIANYSIVTVAKDVRFYLNSVANNTLDRKTACVDLGINAFYHYSFSSIYGLRHHQTVLAGLGERLP